VATKFIAIPLSLLTVMKPSSALVLSYVHYRLKFNVSFIESNEQIAKKIGMSECGVSKIMRKLKEEGFLNSLCKRHNSVTIGSRRDEANQKIVTKAYFRKAWLTKKGAKYYE